MEKIIKTLKGIGLSILVYILSWIIVGASVITIGFLSMGWVLKHMIADDQKITGFKRILGQQADRDTVNSGKSAGERLLNFIRNTNEKLDRFHSGYKYLFFGQIAANLFYCSSLFPNFPLSKVYANYIPTGTILIGILFAFIVGFLNSDTQNNQ